MTVPRRVAIGVFGGVLTATAFLAVGFVRALIALIAGRHVSFQDLWPTIGWYVGGFVVAGMVAGLFWDITRHRLGRWLLALMGAACVVGALFMQSDGAPWTWAHDTIVGFTGLSLVFGLAAGLGIDRGYRRGGFRM